MSLKLWLNKPYPQIDENKLRLAVSFCVGLVCFIFLLIFKPFGLEEVTQVSYLAGFGLNCVIAVLINYFLLPFVFPKFYNPAKWSVKKELLFFATILVMISILNYLYNSTVGKELSPQYNFLTFLYMTSMVGVLPILLMTYLTETVARRRNESEAEGLGISEKSKIDLEEKEDVKIIKIEDESVSGNEFSIALPHFLYAASSNNYSEIYFEKDGVVEKVLLRLSLKKLADQVADYSELIRCHKSYLVNKKNIEEISGNARSLVLSIRGISDEIPVSRTFDRDLLL